LVHQVAMSARELRAGQRRVFKMATFSLRSQS
jgi:hypothetical protein